MIGGMLGNNSCGSNSVVYGSTRDHVLEVEGFLSDGTFVHFKAEDPHQTVQTLQPGSRLHNIYAHTIAALANPVNQKIFNRNFLSQQSNVAIQVMP